MPLYNSTFSPDNSGEINTLTDKPVPVDADQLVIEDSAAGFVKKKIRVGHVCPESTLITAVDAPTTTSGTDVLVTSMTVTPEAGTYLVTFSGSFTNGSSGATTYVSLWYNGGQIASSECRYYRSGAQSAIVPFCCVAKITASGALAIEGRWRTSAGSTGTMYQRVLSIVKVS